MVSFVRYDHNGIMTSIEEGLGRSKVVFSSYVFLLFAYIVYIDYNESKIWNLLTRLLVYVQVYDRTKQQQKNDKNNKLIFFYC